jgi:L,D-transpeptidase ErfK/SrfK
MEIFIMVIRYKIIVLVLLLAASNITFANYSKQLCSDPNYTCIKVKRGSTWDQLFPDLKTQNIVRKINRMNIELSPGMIIALPNHMDKYDPLLYAPFPQRISPLRRTVIVVDLDEQAFAAYDTFGALVYWGPVSAGKSYCPDIGRSCRTPIGIYYVQNKGGTDCHSSKYPIPNGGAPMPYCMYFHGGYAMHASAEVPGYNASHGCVRLFLSDAEWLNKNFVELGENKTAVIVRP